MKFYKMENKMKNLKVFCLVVLFFISANNLILAQNTQPTAYQKKQLELSKKYFQIFYGYNMTMADEAFYNQLAEGEDAQEFLLAMGILSYAMSNPEAEVKKVLTQMKKEYEQAEKLKTVIDYQRETEAKYAKTDAGKIKAQIKKEFENWNKKGEFESQSDYQSRLQTGSKNEFYKICLKHIKDKINSLNKEVEFTKELNSYNTEREKFPVLFSFNSIKWQNDIFVSIENAPKLKNNWSSIKYKIDDFDWCFVNDSLCPSSITLIDGNNSYTNILPLKTQKDIKYSFDDFKIDNSFLKGYVFNFSTVKKDKQHLAELNAQLDLQFKSYNNKLSENPYNIFNKSIKQYTKIEKIENMNGIYEQQATAMKSEFNYLNSNFEKNLKSQNFEKYIVVYYSINTAKKQEADKTYLEYSCHYYSRIDFDKDFIDNKLSEGNCRELKYAESSDLFTSKEEFNKFYNLGEEVIQEELKNRRLKKEEEAILLIIKSNSTIVEKLNFKDAKVNPEDSNVKEYFLMTNSNIEKPYYSKVIDSLIEINKGIQKEWSKRGSLFSNKTEFFEAFTSGDYKSILKEKKK